MTAVSWLIELTVKLGEFEKCQLLMHEMIESAETQEGILNYEWSMNDAGDVCHIYERFENSDAAMAHLTSGEKFIECFSSVFVPTRLLVYGAPNDQVKEALAAFRPAFMISVGGFAR